MNAKELVFESISFGKYNDPNKGDSPGPFVLVHCADGNYIEFRKEEQSGRWYATKILEPKRRGGYKTIRVEMSTDESEVAFVEIDEFVSMALERVQ